MRRVEEKKKERNAAGGVGRDAGLQDDAAEGRAEQPGGREFLLKRKEKKRGQNDVRAEKAGRWRCPSAEHGAEPCGDACEKARESGRGEGRVVQAVEQARLWMGRHVARKRKASGKANPPGRLGTAPQRAAMAAGRAQGWERQRTGPLPPRSSPM